MKNGIICLETEWEHTVKKNRLSLHTEALLDFLAKSLGCKIIYRRVATKSELVYYFKRFALAEYSDYSVFYLSFHGDTHSIHLEGEKSGELSLSELADISCGAFENRFVHFSSCRTLLGSEKDLQIFKDQSGALLLSGYTTSVDSVLSAINDIAYFDQIFRHPQRKASVAPAMKNLYEGLNKKLGFKII